MLREQQTEAREQLMLHVMVGTIIQMVMMGVAIKRIGDTPQVPGGIMLIYMARTDCQKVKIRTSQ